VIELPSSYIENMATEDDFTVLMTWVGATLDGVPAPVCGVECKRCRFRMVVRVLASDGLTCPACARKRESEKPEGPKS
jgi:hypothetical protein